MSIRKEILEAFSELQLTHPNYKAEAYQFVSDAVNYTVERLQARRHVSALELLKGMRDLAHEKYGAVAPEVLKCWGLRSAEAAGEVVYLLIQVHLLSASPEDNIEDFNVDFSWSYPDKTERPELPPLPFID